MTMHDDELMALVAEVLDRTEPIPASAVDAAYAAIEMRRLDDELAALVFDSWNDREMVLMRGSEPETRLLSFTNDHTTLDLELRADGAITGQMAPIVPGAIELEVADHDDVLTVEADRFGRFRCAAPAGFIRLRIAGHLVTPWISHLED